MDTWLFWQKYVTICLKCLSLWRTHGHIWYTILHTQHGSNMTLVMAVSLRRLVSMVPLKSKPSLDHVHFLDWHVSSTVAWVSLLCNRRSSCVLWETTKCHENAWLVPCHHLLSSQRLLTWKLGTLPWDQDLVALDCNNRTRASPQASSLLLHKKRKKAHFTPSSACSRVTEPQHWYAADTTSQHAISLPLSVSRSTPASQPSLKRSGWSHALIGPHQQPGQNGALLAQLQSGVNTQTNKQTNEDINKPHGSSLGTWGMGRSKEEGWPAATGTDVET